MSSRKNDNRSNPNTGRLIVLGVILLFTVPSVMIPIAVIGTIIYAITKSKAAQKSAASRQTNTQANRQNYSQPNQQNSAQLSRNSYAFDDCPRSSLFCFHKDKGEHHVRKGKEIDPWDRPDIDISKYQRKR